MNPTSKSVPLKTIVPACLLLSKKQLAIKRILQKLIGADAETHSQTLRAWRVLLKRGSKNCRSHRGQGHHSNIVYRINSVELLGVNRDWRKNQGAWMSLTKVFGLYVKTFVAWYPYRTTSSKSKGCFWCSCLRLRTSS